MTDKERTLEFLRSLGIEPDFKDRTGTSDVGRTALVLDSINFGGYSGFQAVFEFDRDGKFMPKYSGFQAVFEFDRDGKFMPNKDNQSKDSITGVWE